MGFTEAMMDHANQCSQVAKNKERTSNVMNAKIKQEASIKMATAAYATLQMDGGSNLTHIVSVTILCFLNRDLNVHNAMIYSQIVENANLLRICNTKTNLFLKKLGNMEINLNIYHV